MQIQFLTNTQVVSAVHAETGNSTWMFVLDWNARSIELHRDKKKLASYDNCQFPPSVDYLETLIKNLINVRTLQ